MEKGEGESGCDEVVNNFCNRADVNRDTDVDGDDLIAVSGKYGESY